MVLDPDTEELLTDRTVTVGGRDWTLTAVPDPDLLLARVQNDAEMETFPFGLMLWPSAIGLAERLADEPALVAGKRVIELGAGIGLPSLVARSLGADVTHTDYQDAPLSLARRNAERNSITGIAYQTLDWRQPPALVPFDVILASDVLYEKTLHAPLFDLLPGLLAPGGVLLLADPLRPKAIRFIDAMESRGWSWQFEGRPVAWKDSVREIAVFTARRRGDLGGAG